jgi:hypothetical protein
VRRCQAHGSNSLPRSERNWRQIPRMRRLTTRAGTLVQVAIVDRDNRKASKLALACSKTPL